MTAKRQDRVFIEDMLTRITMIEDFTVPGRDIFMQSKMMQEAVIRSLEVIGEASRNISDVVRETNTDIAWRQIIAFRNFAAHVYWDIKLDRVWSIISQDLPTLKSQLLTLLDSLPADKEDAP